MTAKANEPAYPNLREQVGENIYREISSGGATMRQRYKLAALQGLCANPAHTNTHSQYLVHLASDHADAACAEDEDHEKG